MKKKNRFFKVIIIIMIIFVFCMLMLCIALLKHNEIIDEDGSFSMEDLRESVTGSSNNNNNKENSNDPLANDPDVKYDNKKDYKDLKELLQAFNITYRFERHRDDEPYTVSVVFPKGLFNEDGTENKAYFEEVFKKSADFIEFNKFRFYDEYKKLTIDVIVDDSTKNISYTINNMEDYFSKFNYEKYKQAMETKIVDKTRMVMPDGMLRNLYNATMMVTNDLGDSEYAYGNYIYYKNGTVKLISSNARIVNMVLLEGYDEEIVSGVYKTTTLDKIYELYPDVAFGGLKDGYLGYRSGDVYYFFYPDEVSIYRYTYESTYKFDNLLSDYFETHNLDNFVNELQQLWKSYTTFEYDKDERYFKAVYPTLGIEIEVIKNVDVKIKIYSNFMIDEKIANYVADGRITLLSEQDSIYEYEKERRKNEPSEKNEEYKEFKHINKTEITTEENVEQQKKEDGIEVVKID